MIRLFLKSLKINNLTVIHGSVFGVAAKGGGGGG